MTVQGALNVKKENNQPNVRVFVKIFSFVLICLLISIMMAYFRRRGEAFRWISSTNFGYMRTILQSSIHFFGNYSLFIQYLLCLLTIII